MKNIAFSFTQRFLLIVVTLILALHTKEIKAQTITTLPLANVSLCACSQIIVSYTATEYTPREMYFLYNCQTMSETLWVPL
ncbi:MAG: hypothetical protein IPF62_12810 [Bacteroidetes bacterium]|nr:hypothetical protein [Bacteroidota bacterium]